MDKHTAAAALIGVTGLLVALAGTAAAGHDRFTDGPFGPHEAGVHFVADAGITGGCNAEGTQYCPSDDVTRAQMGTFLHRLSGNSSVPPSVNARELEGLTAEDILGTGSAAPSVNAAELEGLTVQELVTLLTDQYYVRQEDYTDGAGAAFCDPGDVAISGSYIQRGTLGFLEADLTYVDEDSQRDGWAVFFKDGSGNRVGEGQVIVKCQRISDPADVSAQPTE